MHLARLIPWVIPLGCLAPPSVALCQDAKLWASDAAPDIQFGTAVAVSGDWLIVGAPYEASIQSPSGAAYIYERSGSEWIETQKLKAAPTLFAQTFGSSVAIDGDIAAVGAPGDSQITTSGGAVYTFERQGQQWVQTGRLSASDWSTSTHRQLGFSVSVSGDRILAGALYDGSPTDSGAAYVFVRQAGNWTQEAKLEPSDLQVFARFGYSVALDGDHALVGCPYNDGPVTNSGAAYVFERRQTGWVQTVKLTADDAWYDDNLGMSVAIQGGLAAVGATKHDHSATQAGGAAYIFELGELGWVQRQELLASDSSMFDLFGVSIALDGDLAVIAAEQHDDLGEGIGLGCGAVYAFRRFGAAWGQIGKMIASDGTHNDSFGRSVGLDDAMTVVGAPLDDPECATDCQSGSAYTFTLAPDATQYCSCGSEAPCGNADSHGGCINSTGFGAVLAAAGTSSVASDSLTLTVTHLRPFGTGLVFMGGGGGATPFANGIRCVSAGTGGIYRFGAQTISDAGTLVQGPGLVAYSANFPPPGLIAAGSVWYFQCWYRDALGPCGATSNFSNALAVSFQP